MKKYLIALAALLPTTTVVQAAPVSWDFTSNVLRPLQSMWNSEVRVPWLTATSTTATSTLPIASSTTFCLGSDCRTSWPTSGSSFGTTSIDTSAELAGILTDETGTGAAVFGTSPTFTGNATSSVASNFVAATSTHFTIYDSSNGNTWSTVNPWGCIDWKTADNGPGAGVKTYSALCNIMTNGNGNNSRLGIFVSENGVSGLSRERMSLTDDGFVGIGTTSPSHTLTVSGNARITGALRDSSNSAGTSNQLLTATTTGTAWVTGSALCVAITGSASLCDGVDDTAAGGSGLATSSTWTVGNLARVASNGAVNSIATSALALLITDTVGTLTETRGGTNQTSYATGDILYASSANTLAKLAIGATGQVLMVQGGVPTWTSTSSLGISGGSNTVYLSTSTGRWPAGGLVFRDTDGSVYATTTLSSAELATLITDETGSGSLVFSAAANLTGNTQSPTLRGGSGNTSTLTLRGTTGAAPTTAAGVIFTYGASAGFESARMVAPTGFWGFGTTAPSSLVSIAGDLTLTGALVDSASSTGSNGMVLQSTGNSTRWVSTSSLGISGGSVGATTTLIAGSGVSFTGGTPVILGSSPITIEATGGGGGGALSTTTDIVGDGAAATVSYVTTDVMFGGSASTSAEFQFDKDGGKLIIATSGTTTIANVNGWNAVQFGIASTSGNALVRGIHWAFASSTQLVTSFVGGITEWLIQIARVVFSGEVIVLGDLYVATSTYYGGTTTDMIMVDGTINTGEWTQEFCTSPQAETTQIAADTARFCNRWYAVEDTNGVIDFVVPAASSSYFRIRPGATGASTAAGDGMAVSFGGSGLTVLNQLVKTRPVMEWAWRLDAMSAATSTTFLGGLTATTGLSPDYAAEPGQGFYVIATSTANWRFACNPAAGAGSTQYFDTGIPTSTTAVASANEFVHWRLELTGTTSANTVAVLKARTSTTTMQQVASCSINVSADTNFLNPTISVGKSTVGASPELHLAWVKLWYRHWLY